MKHVVPENFTLGFAEKEKRQKNISFYWPCDLFIMLIRPKPVALVILIFPTYLSTFGLLFDLEQVV